MKIRPGGACDIAEQSNGIATGCQVIPGLSDTTAGQKRKMGLLSVLPDALCSRLAQIEFKIATPAFSFSSVVA